MFSYTDQPRKPMIGASLARKIARRGGATLVLGLWAVSHGALTPRLVHAQESATETTSVTDDPNGPNVESTDGTQGTDTTEGVDTTAGDEVTTADAEDTTAAPATAAKTIKKPTAPAHLKAQWSGTDANGHLTGVVLTWDAVPGAIGYNVYRGLQVIPRPAGPTALIAHGVKKNTFSDPSVSMGIDVVYHYQVTAVNAAGESVKSNSATPTLDTRLAAPAHLRAHWTGTDANGHLRGVALTWDAVTRATSYNIYRGNKVAPRPAGATTLLRQGITGTSYTDAAVSAGVDTTPVYQVTAVNAAGESLKSTIAQPTVSPVMLSATEPNITTHSLRLTFSGPLEVTAATDAAQYIVQVNSHTVPVQSASYDARTHRVTLVLPAKSLTRGIVTVNWTDLSDTSDNPVLGQVAIQID